MEDQAENGKIRGQAKDAGAKRLDESKLEDPSQEELNVTEKGELTEDDWGGALGLGYIENGCLFTKSCEQLELVEEPAVLLPQRIFYK